MIVPADVNNGSTDLRYYLLTLDKTKFGNVGANTVTLKVTDKNGNVATKTAIVTVERDKQLQLFCRRISFSKQCWLLRLLLDINNGSTDNVGLRLCL
jgi:hypothetical protein